MTKSIPNLDSKTNKKHQQLLKMDKLKEMGIELKDEQVKARKQPGCALIFPATLNMAAGIAMVAVGAGFKGDCDGNIGEEASMFLGW